MTDSSQQQSISDDHAGAYLEATWGACKIEVDKLPANYDSVLRSSKKTPKRFEVGKYDVTQLESVVNGFDVHLVVYDPKEPKKYDAIAWYVAFNKHAGTCYKRVLTEL